MRHTPWIIQAFATCMLLLLASSCRKDYFVPAAISETDTLSFANDIQPIFTASCLGSGCHGTNGGLPPFLDPGMSHESLLGGNYVDTVNPELSTLYLRLIASSNYMPPSNKLPQAEIKKILIWIKQGALNN